MRRIGLALASGALLASAAEARTPFVAEFLIVETGRAVTAAAERDGDAIYVDAQILLALGLAPPPGDGPYALHEIAGLSFAVDEAEAAVRISCAAACYPRTTLPAQAASAQALTEAANGFFLNSETNVSYVAGAGELAGAFELGAFGPWGFFEQSWIGGARSVRLDTAWTLDDPARRTRLRVGDALTRGGLGAAPVRFAGVRWGIDFALDPSFVSYPTPLLAGEAAAAAVVDVYIDDALRYRSETPAGPFSIPDAPVTAGAGVARVVVTDALGRQQTISQPFYASPAMLRPGLTDFSLEAGVLRENYGAESLDYGAAFISGGARRGLTPWLTAAVRADAGDELLSFGAGLSATHDGLGQFDATAAFSDADGADGGYAAFGWTRAGGAFSGAAAIEAASEDYRRRGEARAATRFGARLSAGWRVRRLGAVRVSYAARARYGEDAARIASLSYAPALGAWGDVSLSLSWTGAAEDALSFGLALTQPLGGGGARSAQISRDGGAITARVEAQRAAAHAGGLGYKLGATTGGVERVDAALITSGPSGEGRLELSRVDGRTGYRGRYAFGVARLDGGLYVTRPLHDAFAVIDVGAPHVRVEHDGRALGRSGGDGRVFAPALRAYEANRVSAAIDDLPLRAAAANDAVIVRPRARTGAVVRLPIVAARAGEARIVDASGAPLPQGSVLTGPDGARFPIGADGRAYLSLAGGETVLRRGALCWVRVTAADLAASATLVCAP